MVLIEGAEKVKTSSIDFVDRIVSIEYKICEQVIYNVEACVED